jgi:hypothetical protein
MARAVTEKFEEMILDVEFTAGSGVYAPICGMTDVTINRTSNIDTSEIPDCDDESLPLALERQVRSQEVTVSATGVWARSSQSLLKTWWLSGETLNVRLRDTAAASGDIEIESGAAILASLNNSRTKGQKVTSEIEIQFDGVPTTTVAS